MQNNYFKECGLSLRVDLPGKSPQEHTGQARMRSVLNQAVESNEEKPFANIELLKSGEDVTRKVTKHLSVFNRGDLKRAVKIVPDADLRAQEKKIIRLADYVAAEKSAVSLLGSKMAQKRSRVIKAGSVHMSLQSLT